MTQTEAPPTTTEAPAPAPKAQKKKATAKKAPPKSKRAAPAMQHLMPVIMEQIVSPRLKESIARLTRVGSYADVARSYAALYNYPVSANTIRDWMKACGYEFVRSMQVLQPNAVVRPGPAVQALMPGVQVRPATTEDGLDSVSPDPNLRRSLPTPRLAMPGAPAEQGEFNPFPSRLVPSGDLNL